MKIDDRLQTLRKERETLLPAAERDPGPIQAAVDSARQNYLECYPSSKGQRPEAPFGIRVTVAGVPAHPGQVAADDAYKLAINMYDAIGEAEERLARVEADRERALDRIREIDAQLNHELDAQAAIIDATQAATDGAAREREIAIASEAIVRLNDEITGLERKASSAVDEAVGAAVVRALAGQPVAPVKVATVDGEIAYRRKVVTEIQAKRAEMVAGLAAFAERAAAASGRYLEATEAKARLGFEVAIADFLPHVENLLAARLATGASIVTDEGKILTPTLDVSHARILTAADVLRGECAAWRPTLQMATDAAVPAGDVAGAIAGTPARSARQAA